jgi:hypothetical protein
MNDDDFSVTMRTSLHRPEALALVIEGYRVMAGAAADRGRRLWARMRSSHFQGRLRPMLTETSSARRQAGPAASQSA